MSGLSLDITYNDVVTKVVGIIKTNCSNIGNNYTNLPACYKANFTQTYECIKTSVPPESGWDTTGNAWTPSFTVKINDYVKKVTEATVKSEFETFLTSTCKLPALTETVYDNKFLNLMIDITSFLSVKCLQVCVSPYDTKFYEDMTDEDSGCQNKTKGKNVVTPKLKSGKTETGYLIYDQTATKTFNNTQSLAGSTKSTKTIMASDMQPFFDSLMVTMNKNTKVKAINYTVTFS